jgi:hypothetical protein
LPSNLALFGGGASASMVWNYAFGFAATLLMAMLAGFPAAVWCGVGRGVRALGYASALGTSFLLIACRGVQMMAPLGNARWPMFAVFAIALTIAWSRPVTRAAFVELLRDHGRGLAIVMLAAVAVGVALGAPILFGHAIQYDGTRNADSFTFTQSAQYMIGHAFFGAPDFTPEHPVYTISRGYFGADAMQPRPAAEGLLAWLSALRGIDPMYLYNAVQAAGVMLAGLAALAFLPRDWRARGAKDWALLAVYVVACPTLVHIAANSNFANGFNLPAATAYVALGLMPRSRGSFFASIVFIASLLSGYPELLVFVAITRGIAVVFEGFSRRAPGAMFREAIWMMAELVAACVVVPWAALATYSVFKTTLGVSHAGASDLGGNMYAGVPMFAAAAIALAVAWRALGSTLDAGRRWYLMGILVAFALAQAVMLARGFDYGGFKVSEYFVTLLVGVVLRSVLVGATGLQPGRTAKALAVVLAVVMLMKSADIVRRAWDWSQSRRVTPDLVAAGRALGPLSRGQPVAMGTSPEPFYYGMWVPYVASAPIAFDLIRDPDAAGYLSPYLRLTGRTQAMLDAAQLQLDIDAKQDDEAPPVAHFGDVVIRPKSAPHGGA